MRRRLATLILLAWASAWAGGCGGADDDDVAEVKTPMPLDRVPAVVMKTARESGPGLTFFAAYSGTYQGRASIEVRGKTRSGQVKELEISPDGKLLGAE